jgi:putative flippase GtrA
LNSLVDRDGTLGQVTRFVRYAIGSGLATVTSAVAFAIVYRVLGEGPRLASVTAFLAGAVVNFTRNRFWAWRRTRPGLGRDALFYAIVAVVSALAATGVTSLTHAALAEADPNRRAVLVEVSYFATYAVLFLLKFVVLDRFVFHTKARNQVDSTTRA